MERKFPPPRSPYSTCQPIESSGMSNPCDEFELGVQEMCNLQAPPEPSKKEGLTEDQLELLDRVVFIVGIVLAVIVIKLIIGA